MKIKNIVNRIYILASGVSLIACTANFEEINTDPYGVTDEEMERDAYSVRAALVGISNGVISPDVNTAQYTECLLGGTMAGYLADANPGFKNTISNYNPVDGWTNVLMASDKVIPVIYTNYNMIKSVTDDPIILAVADIIKVAAMHRITDAYGPIPYSKIGKDGAINVAYDSQEDVYKLMFKELDAAIESLTPNRTNNFNPTSDVVYKGNTENWIKFANSLKLRLAMRISYADTELAKAMAESAVAHEVGVFTSNSDNALFTSFGVNGNPINVAVEYNKLDKHEDETGSACTTESGDSHAAADIICYMNGYNDPRREAYFTSSEFEGIGYCGLRHGIIIPDHKSIGHKYSGVAIDSDDPLVWMNAAEVAFLKAEAAAVFGFNMGGSAKEFYEEGIRLSFEQWGAGDATEYIADNTSIPTVYTDPAGSNTYEGTISTITVAWDESASTEIKQERIITQKWIANWLLGNESWADWRRTGYPHLIPATKDGNMSSGIVNSELGARRIPYPDSEALVNGENYKSAVLTLLKGEDNMATRLWFDCKNK